MLRTLLYSVPARSILCPYLQFPQSVSHKRLPSNSLFLSVVSRNCAKVAPDESIENEAKPSRKHNPFAQTKLTSNTEANIKNASYTSEEERVKLLKVLQLELDIAHQEGRRVPALESVTDENWAHILTLPSKSARNKYYSYLWQIETKKEAKERKKQERALQVIEHKQELRKQREENQHIIYGLGHTSLFLRIYDSTINHFQNNRLTRAMQFSPKIVLDCSYDQHMTRREALNAAKQLMLCFAENRAHDDPFDLHYCNVNLNSISTKALNRYIPTMMNPEFPMNVHEKCFTELFPRENLVYLTPHCRTDLVKYNPDDVYIIGAMVDTVNNEPLSLAKAKRLGIRMARLPLDRYLQWGAGSGKSLTLNQMVNILLDLKTTKDWTHALRHVPRRKVIDMATDALRQKRALERRAGQLNFRLDDTLDERDRNERDLQNPKVRTYKKNAQFNLETWGSKKKNRNSS
ncbi:mitochondrial ribonuclease P protein 1 homolog [Anastrepha obliqua]|uniref:mitochondrial ribonuclease P protein 1 homolog n=1 Tax=Anastrepha obliqua TaxID=95512 RepID=UPI002409A415|nr:mitochondrial ribonuclease P protein 1 homolog [Anastrepha obliqua]